MDYSKTNIYDRKATSSTYQIRERFAGVSNVAAKRSYYDNKVDGLAETNPKKW